MQSVIGVFDTREDAESARDALVRAGFDEDDVRVQSHRSVQSGDSDSRKADEDEGFMAKVGHFFGDLFGGSEAESRDAGHYAEHVRRGGSVVVVEVPNESRVDEARAALASAGAVDIDRRTEAWREEGYAGFSASAQPYDLDEIAAERSRSQRSDRSDRGDRGDRTMPLAQEDLEVSKRPMDLGAVRVVSRTEAQAVKAPGDLRAGEGGAIELSDSTEQPAVDKTGRGVDMEKSGRMRDVSGSSAEADMGLGMAGSRYSTTDAGGDTLSAGNTFSGADDAPSAMSWKERSPNAPAYDDRMTAGSSMSPDDSLAYHYGSTLRSDQRYADRSSWDEVEADAQADWRQRNPGSNWEQAKAAVRHGWESMTGRR